MADFPLQEVLLLVLIITLFITLPFLHIHLALSLGIGCPFPGERIFLIRDSVRDKPRSDFDFAGLARELDCIPN